MTDFLNGKVTLHGGDCREVIKTLAGASVDSVVTDPPYALVSISKRFGAARSNMHEPAGTKPHGSPQYQRLARGFMGKQWDNGEAAFAVEFWAEVMRVLKPGGHVVAFSGTRTYHRLACAIEDAGFEVRDQLGWLYGSGFPKSHDVSKGIDKAKGLTDERGYVPATGVQPAGSGNTVGAFTGRQLSDVPVSPEAAEWQGWGTALKPAWEPIVLARKPLIGTVAENVLAHGTGALNIDGCRVESDGVDLGRNNNARTVGTSYVVQREARRIDNSGDKGRWPANIVHDGSEEVLAAFPDRDTTRSTVTSKPGSVYGNGAGLPPHTGIYGADESGSAARFFYTAKADAEDRAGSKHPTVKPVDLMQWLVRLTTPKGGLVLDPFAGSGTTGEAAWREGMRCILIEREEEYQADIARRLEMADAGPDARLHSRLKAAGKVEEPESLPLFGGANDNTDAAGAA